MHGLNLVHKRKPYVPPDGPTGFTKQDAAWLARHGFTRPGSARSGPGSRPVARAGRRGLPRPVAAGARAAGQNAVREIDPDNIVWWEPQQLAGGQEVDTFFTAPADEKQLGLSWHNYCPAVFLESLGVPGTDVQSCARTPTAESSTRSTSRSGWTHCR